MQELFLYYKHHKILLSFFNCLISPKQDQFLLVMILNLDFIKNNYIHYMRQI